MGSSLAKKLSGKMNTAPVTERAERAFDSALIGRATRESEPVVMLPLDCLHESRYQSKGKVSDAHTDALLASIEENGVVTPIVVRPIGGHSMSTDGGGHSMSTDGGGAEQTSAPVGDTPLERHLGHTMSTRAKGQQYEIITGHTRVNVVRRLGQQFIQAVIKPMTDVEAARALTADNSLHKALTDWEKYKHVVMLRAVGAASGQRDLGDLLGCAKTTIQYIEDFGKLPPETHLMFDAEPGLIGYNLAHELARYVPDHTAAVIEAIELVSAEKLKPSGVLSWIRRHIAAPASAPTHARKELTFQRGNRKVTFVSAKGAAKVSGDIDLDKLHHLIEENLDALLK